MTDKQSTVVVSNVIAKLRMAQCGSCSCLTKTNDPAWHKEKCLYRVLSEAIEILAAPVEQQGEPAAYKVKYHLTESLESAAAFASNYGVPREQIYPLYRRAQPPDKVDPDKLSNFIREIDGNHSLGAGRLAELIAEHLNAPQR